MDEDPHQNAPSEPTSAQPSPEASPLRLAGLGVQFVVALLGFAYAGNWIDRRLGIAPIGLLVGVFLGGGGTFYLSIRRLTASTATAPTSKVHKRQDHR